MARTNRYCDPDLDVRELVEKITDNVIEDTDVNYLVDVACDIIDSKLVYKYTVPFTTTYPLLKHISSHLATYLVLRRIFSKTVSARGEEVWYDKFKDFAEEMLKGLVVGEMILIDSSGNAVAIKSDYGAKISTADYTPIFNEGGELDWEVDEDKVDASVGGRN